MGGKNFFKIVVQKKDDPVTIAELGETLPLGELRGARVGVDASLMIYSSILALREVHGLTDSKGNPTAHLNTIFNKVLQLAKAGVQQVWLFDSPEPSEMKKAELARRAARRAASEDERVQFKLSAKEVNETRDMLLNLGIMCIEAPSQIEAEQYGAYLSSGPLSKRFCRYIISGDSDVLLFGGNLLRVVNVKSATGKSSKTVYQAFELQDLLESIDMSHTQLVKMAIAMGTDFNDKTPRVGEKTVYKKIKTLKNDTDLFTFKQMEALKKFCEDIGPQASSAKIEEASYNREAVIDFLVSKNFNRELLVKKLDDYELSRKNL